jgi:hypothetical protein
MTGAQPGVAERFDERAGAPGGQWQRRGDGRTDNDAIGQQAPPQARTAAISRASGERMAPRWRLVRMTVEAAAIAARLTRKDQSPTAMETDALDLAGSDPSR